MHMIHYFFNSLFMVMANAVFRYFTFSDIRTTKRIKLCICLDFIAQAVAAHEKVLIKILIASTTKMNTLYTMFNQIYIVHFNKLQQ